MPAIPEAPLLAAALAIHRAACPLRDDPDHDCARDAAHEEMLIPRARAALEAAAPLLAEAWGADDGATMAVEWGIRQNMTPGHLWSYGFDEQRARKERPLIYGGGTLVRRTVTYGEWEVVDS